MSNADNVPGVMERDGWAAQFPEAALHRSGGGEGVGNWMLVYDGYDPDQEGLREALCTVGNGYVCTRGAAPDTAADGVHYPGTYLAGGYNRATTRIADRDIENEDLVNMPNWLPLTMRVDGGDWFHIDRVEVLSYCQILDVRSGVLLRSMRFRDGAGRTTRWAERRLASMADPHLVALRVDIEAEDWSGRLTVRSAIDGGVVNDGVARYRDLNSRHLETLETVQPEDDLIVLRTRTNQSRIEVAEAARTRLYRGDERVETGRRTDRRDDWIGQEIDADLGQADAITVEKIVCIHSSRDNAISEPGWQARRRAGDAPRFDTLLADHRLAWKHLWEECDIDICMTPVPDANLKLRVHIFHLLQTVSPHSVDLDIGVPPRGWHGEAYRGHIFWDELFIFPFLTLRLPTLTQALLRYRYRRLPEARRAAREAGLRGAMFPWQSGSDGREESQRLHLNPKSGRWIPDNTHRQRHINAAIAYNIWHYFQVTDDHQFMDFYGAEMLLEIARFWASVAEHDPADDRYHIRGVMGPDEYHTAYPGADPTKAGGLDDNAYTNVMAAWVLTRARDVLDLLPRDHAAKLCEWIGLEEAEIECWEDIGRRMSIPCHDGIICQFAGYEKLKEFDWDGYRKKYGDIQRVDRILEAENDTPNRYKVSKQADVLMLFYLFSADELELMFERMGYGFDRDLIPRNIDYYLQRTSHGSTLSRVVHSWVLTRSARPLSWDLLRGALDSDIHDIQGGTTPEGIHLGAMAGTVDLVQRCLTGLETRANVLHFDPSLPEGLDSLQVQLRYRRQKLQVEVDHERLRVSSCQFTAPPITIAYRGHFRDVTPGDTYEFRLIKRLDRTAAEPAPAEAPPVARTAG